MIKQLNTIGRSAFCASVLAAAVASAAQTDHHKEGDKMRVASKDHTRYPMAQAGPCKAEWQRYEKERAQADTEWTEMQDKVIKANVLMSADVTNAFNPLGSVRDLVLSQDSSSVEYVLYDVPYPYSFYGSDDGFASFDNVAIESPVMTDLQLRIDDEESARAKEELRLTKGEADHRLVSNIIGADISFPEENRTTKEIENLLINRKNGRVTHFVIEMDNDSLFSEAPRAIPADRVDIDERGRMSTRLSYNEVDDMQE